MHTKDMLADALEEAGCHAAAELARQGYYHDYLSPLDAPTMQLVEDLTKIGTPEAMAIRERVKDGDFDASKEEADAWAASQDGQEAFARLQEGTVHPLDREWSEFAAGALPKDVTAVQREECRKVFFAGVQVLFNLFGAEATANQGIRPQFIGLIQHRLQTVGEEFKAGMQ